MGMGVEDGLYPTRPQKQHVVAGIGSKDVSVIYNFLSGLVEQSLGVSLLVVSACKFHPSDAFIANSRHGSGSRLQDHF